jgi:PIN domain nuclease of toxin-antitoxin system
MKLLLDTQALIWFLEGDARLTPPAQQAIENQANLKYISMASGWEMAIKTALGKLRLPLPFPELFPGRLETLGLIIFPIQPHHLHRLLNLPRHHGDPFDRLLVAQALTEDFTVIGNDAMFDAFGVRRHW